MKSTLKPIAFINMIPFIDVMLVIFIVLVLVSTTLGLQQLSVNLPKGNIGQYHHQKNTLIYMNQSGQYFLINHSKKSISQHELLVYLQKNTQSVSIMANSKTSYQNIINLMALIKRSPVHHINLIAATKHL